MSNTDLILELLDEIYPKAYCDDCLSKELGIQPRQQVNQIGRRLENNQKITRNQEICAVCGRNKIANKINKKGLQTPETSVPLDKARPVPTPVMSSSKKEPAFTGNIDIEHIRTQIVRVCQQIWKENLKAEPPRSISAIINMLRNENLIPNHQANLMLTLVNLRNSFVYENLNLGPREKTIAINALSIVNEWLEEAHRVTL